MPKSAKLGQNFLRDANIARRIVALVAPGSGPLLEIGPGEGILTQWLLEKAPGRQAILVEVDPQLAAELARRFGTRVEIIAMDILDMDLAGRFPAGPVTVVGNLPYHISKPLVDWLIRQRHSIASAVLMLQRDFIDKLLAPPGGKKYNAQSVMFQLLYAARRCFDVPAGAFAPKPKIVSTVISARPAEAPPPDADKVYPFIKLCFSERRKTLWNNLRACDSDAALTAAFSAAAVPVHARAEQLPPERLLALWRALKTGPAVL